MMYAAIAKAQEETNNAVYHDVPIEKRKEECDETVERIASMLLHSEAVTSRVKEGETQLLMYVSSMATVNDKKELICFPRKGIQATLEGQRNPCCDALRVMLPEDVFAYPKRRLIPSVVIRIFVFYDGPTSSTIERSLYLYARTTGIPEMPVDHFFEHIPIGSKEQTARLLMEMAPRGLYNSYLHEWYQKMSVCASCQRVALNMPICSRCKDVAFCDEACQRDFWTAGHKVECTK